jgi:hypothetical protein
MSITSADSEPAVGRPFQADERREKPCYTVRMAEKPDNAEPRRRWNQFSLRTLLIGVTLAGCGLGWLGIKIREARQQQAAVAAIEKAGGFVEYDYLFGSQPDGGRSPRLSGPAWLHSVLGDDFFRNVVSVDHRGRSFGDADMAQLRGLTQLRRFGLCGARITDAGLEYLTELTKLQELHLAYCEGLTDAGLERLKGLRKLQFLNLVETEIDDAGLERLSGLTQLKKLYLANTRVTDAGVAKLQKALPRCEITR